MNRVLQLAAALSVATFVGGSGATAQSVRFGLGGGLTMPLGDYKTGDNAGWHALGSVDIGIPLSPVGIRVDGMYGQTNHKAPITGHTALAGGLASLVWHIPTAAPLVKPYILAGAGVFNVKTDASVTKLTYGGGAGVALGLGGAHLSIEGRYLSVHSSGGSLNFIPVTAMVTFGGK